MANRAAADILGTDKEQELLQSFVRVGIKEEDDEVKASTLLAPKQDASVKFSDYSIEMGGDFTPRKTKFVSFELKTKHVYVILNQTIILL